MAEQIRSRPTVGAAAGSPVADQHERASPARAQPGGGGGGGGIDIATERLIPAAEVPDHLPRARGGRKVHVSVPYRWMQRGLRGVRLEYLQVGNRRCTSVEALQRFFARLTDPNGGAAHVPTRSTTVSARPGSGGGGQVSAVAELRRLLYGAGRSEGGAR